jgi:hypothetical protein
LPPGIVKGHLLKVSADNHATSERLTGAVPKAASAAP